MLCSEKAESTVVPCFLCNLSCIGTRVVRIGCGNPMGEPSNQKVQIANLMVSRMCCLQLVAVAGSMHLSSLPGSSIAGFPCVLVHKQRLRPWQHATAVIKGSVRLASVYNFEPRWSLGCRQQGHQRREKTLIFRNQKPNATTTYHS